MATAAGRAPLAVRVVAAPMVWLERSRGWKRRLLVVSYLIVGLVLGLFAYREFAIAKLPDVGDSFDVATFKASVRVPDERNAVPLYRAAQKELIASTRNERPLAPGLRDSVTWSNADKATRSWAVAARPALERWREGTKRPEAAWGLPEEATAEGLGLFDVDYSLFITLATLESSRLEEAGDFAEAWRWHRAVLRFLQHYTSNTTLDRRLMGSIRIAQYGTDRISPWADNPEIPREALRRAIGDLEEIAAMTPPSSQTLKFQYVALMNSLDDLPGLTRGWGRSMTYPYEEWKHWYWGYWFLKNEPTRTRRIIKLALANRLPWCDVPYAERPVQVVNPDGGSLMAVYPPGPETPKSGRLLPPAEMFAWADSSLYSRQIPMFGPFEPNAEPDRRRLTYLAMMLAENLYRQEHGAQPKSPEDLVEAGYLKSVPGDSRDTEDQAED